MNTTLDLTIIFYFSASYRYGVARSFLMVIMALLWSYVRRASCVRGTFMALPTALLAALDELRHPCPVVRVLRPSPLPLPCHPCPCARAGRPPALPSLVAPVLAAGCVDGSHPALRRVNTNLTRRSLHPAPERRISTCRMCALHPAPWWMYYIQLLRPDIQLPGGCITSTRSRGCIRADVKFMLSLC